MLVDDSGLVFLISQPRSGSTLTQRILGCHKDIVTAGETWAMFPLAYHLKKTGLAAEYNSRLQKRAFDEFLTQLGDNAKDIYIRRLSSLVLSLYDQQLTPANARYFLDKTPRYYFIIDELQQLFPNAKFLFLLRNPLAVLNSIMTNWVGKEHYRIGEFAYDLFRAPAAIHEAKSRNNISNQFFLSYEKLVTNPNSQVSDVCRFLDIDPIENLGDKLAEKQEAWPFGDRNAFRLAVITSEYVDGWKSNISDRDLAVAAKHYLKLLGIDLVEGLGYSYEELCSYCQHIEATPESTIEELLEDAYHLSRQDFSDLDEVQIELVRAQRRSLRLEIARDEADKRAEERQKRIEGKNQLLDNLQGQIARAHEIIEEKNQLLENFQRQVARAHEIIEEKNRLLENFQRQVARAHEIFAEKENAIDALEREAKEYRPIKQQLRSITALSFWRQPWAKMKSIRHLVKILHSRIES